MIAKGVLRPSKLNKTEQEYGTMLRAREMVGEILWYRYEGITLKLADDTRFTPDFFVMLSNGEFEAHECKGGFFRDDAKVKLKVAAAQFPFRFYLCRKMKGGWTIETI